METAPRAYRVQAALGAAMLVLVVWGFWPSYLRPLLSGTADQALVVHIHAVVFFVWVVLFLVQGALVASGRHAWHRQAGVAGMAWGAVVFVMGLIVSVMAPALRVRAGQLTIDVASRVVLYNLTDLLCFGGLFWAAITTRRRPEAHMRWMLAATVALLGAAIGRRIQDPLVYPLVWLSPLLVSASVDVATTRRVHLVTMVGLGVLVIANLKVSIVAMVPPVATIGRALLSLALP